MRRGGILERAEFFAEMSMFRVAVAPVRSIEPIGKVDAYFFHVFLFGSGWRFNVNASAGAGIESGNLISVTGGYFARQEINTLFRSIRVDIDYVSIARDCGLVCVEFMRPQSRQDEEKQKAHILCLL
jgi:hypothetical protein